MRGPLFGISPFLLGQAPYSGRPRAEKFLRNSRGLPPDEAASAPLGRIGRTRATVDHADASIWRASSL
jgi:hypothetical protein